MSETIEINIENGNDCELTRLRLENGTTFHIFQHPSGSTTIHIHHMNEETDVTIMGRKTTKKLDSLGNTTVKVVE